MSSYTYSYKRKNKKKKMLIVASIVVGIGLVFFSIAFMTNWFGFGSEKILSYLGVKQLEEGENPDFEAVVEEEKEHEDLPPVDTRPKSIYSGLPCDNYNRRAIGVMVSSDQQARPSWGLSQADIVFEIPSTYYWGKHTRLYALFSCNAPEAVRSIRSGRIYSADLSMAMDAMLAHWGYSPEGANYINGLAYQGELNNFNGLYLTENGGFTRNWTNAYRMEDTGTGNIAQMYNYATSLGWRTTSNFEGYRFLTEDDIKLYSTGKGGRLSINFVSAMDSVYYEYDPFNNVYKRYWGNILDSDGITGKQISPSNVIVMQTQIQSQADPHYVYVTTTGSGMAYVYHNGKVIKGTWKRGDKNSDKLYFLDAVGGEIELVPGQTWIEVVESMDQVTWTGYGGE